jgi:hypothetical protein
MNGLPNNINLDFFHGQTLLQICVGANEMIWNFDGYVSIIVTSSFACTPVGGARHGYDDFRSAVGDVAYLVHEIVKSAKGTPDGTLTLEFGDGSRIELYDDSKQFESYVIRNGDEVIVV